MRRQPRGVPIGGQFAEHDRDDDVVELAEVEEAEPVRPHRVLTSRMGEVLHRIELANRRLARAGISDRFEIDAEESVFDHEGRTYAVTDFGLSTPKIGFDGWTVGGVFDFTPDGIPISAYKSDDAVADPVEGVCDHCGTRRRRDRVFVVRHESGEMKQIGRSCLAAFLGIKPEGLWALEFDPEAPERSEAGDEDDEFWLRGVSDADQVFDGDELLLAAVVASDNPAGFVSRSRATVEMPATVDVVLSSFDAHVQKATDSHRERAAAIREWVANLPSDTEQDYLVNLRRVLVGADGVAGSFVRRKHAAIAASAVAAYERHLDALERKAAAASRKAIYKPGFLAPVKEKVADVQATIDFVRSGTSYYGHRETTYTVIAMITADGQRVTWIASSDRDARVGQKVTVSGTVKEHSAREVGGEVLDVTMLTRAKLIDADTGETV